MEILRLSDFPLDRVLPDDYVVFGGTFDPIHEGHVTVLKRLLPIFGLVIVAPTKANPWKPEPPTDFETRAEMIRRVLSYEKVALVNPPSGEKGTSGVLIEEFSYAYSEELVDYLRQKFPGKLFWAAGEDSADSIKDWRNWKQKGVTTLVLPIEIHAHAALVRQGSALPHPAIADYVKTHKLYEK